MFNYKTIVGDNELTVRFKKISDTSYEAIDQNSGNVVGRVDINGYTFEASDDFIFTQYKLWLTRPERAVGKVVDIEDRNMEELIEAYEELLIGAYIMKAGKVSLYSIESGYRGVIDWLRTTDFYTAPASTHYHDSNPGGLLVHSLKVYNQALGLMKNPVFKNVNIADLTIVTLVHDWCKIGFYESYLKNVKDEKTGEWNKEAAYRRNPKGITLGHGATSMYLVSRCFHLSFEMAAAIRWHMGEYNIAPNEMDELHKANSMYPLCYLLQFADRLACVEWAQR